jgi:hypothetical protein
MEKKMKTTKQVVNDSGIPAKLVHAVIRQLGDKESLTDIANHGIDGGFSGFIYTSDTVAFFKRNRKEIVQLVNEMADSLGEEPIKMVASFNCLGKQDPKAQREYYPSVARCLYGKCTDEDSDVANALAWFAGEEVARAFED